MLGGEGGGSCIAEEREIRRRGAKKEVEGRAGGRGTLAKSWMASCCSGHLYTPTSLRAISSSSWSSASNTDRGDALCREEAEEEEEEERALTAWHHVTHASGKGTVRYHCTLSAVARDHTRTEDVSAPHHAV